MIYSNAILSLLASTALVAVARGNAIPPAQTVDTDTAALVERQGACPAVWSTIASDLASDFSGCVLRGPFAIRFAFHDAAGYSSLTPFYEPAAGGADGSLLLSAGEISYNLESPLTIYKTFLNAKMDTYSQSGNVSAADLVQFAASVAIRACGGPVVKTVVGRQSTSQAAPDGMLPNGFGALAAAGTLTQLFAEKGISPTEMTALLGAHTVARAFAQANHGVSVGAEQDTTPTIWDNKFYSDTLNKASGITSFPSDLNIAAASETSAAWMLFATNSTAWDEAFTAAMYKLSLLGIPDQVSSTFTDCTYVIG